MLRCMSDEMTDAPAIPPMPPVDLPVPVKSRRRWVVQLAAGVAGLVVGAGGVGLAWGMSGSPVAKPFVLRGSLVLSDPTPTDSNYTGCTGSGGYDDIVPGAAVTVYDAGGKVVANGALGEGRYASTDSTAPCVFKFVVPGVPDGAKFYQVEISHRGKLTVSAAKAKAGTFASSLG